MPDAQALRPHCKGCAQCPRNNGSAALDVFSECKTVYVDFSSRLQRAQIDNR